MFLDDSLHVQTLMFEVRWSCGCSVQL